MSTKPMRYLLPGFGLLGIAGLALLALPAQAQPVHHPPYDVAPTAFQPGEELVYSVAYGMMKAGEMRFKIDERTYEFRGEQCYRIIGTGRTHASFEWFYRVRDEFYTYLSKKRLQPLRYRRTAREGDYRYSDEVTFDYKDRAIQGKRGTFNMQVGIQDMVSAFFMARNLALQHAEPGETWHIPTFIDDKVYDLGMRYLGRETITTDRGTFRCLVIAPIIVAGRVFEGRQEMKIWVTDDANRIPVKIHTKLTVGSATAYLEAFRKLRHPLQAKVAHE
jgi:hypothetical protein